MLAITAHAESISKLSKDSLKMATSKKRWMKFHCAAEQDLRGVSALDPHTALLAMCHT